MTTRKFPLQTQRDVPPGPLEIPWSVAEKAYGAYVAEYGRCQSLERLAERGGFGWGEMDKLYPAWRQEVDEIARLRADLAAAAAEREWQPISTAPKDGREVLTGAWVGDEWAWRGDWYGNYHGSKLSWWPLEDGEGNKTVPPTHWLPLPSPPAAALRPAGEAKGGGP